MATRSARRPGQVVVRRSATVAKSRFEALKQRSRSAAKRLKEVSEEDAEMATGVAAGVGLALLEKSGRQLPTIAGFDPAITWGFVGYALTRRSKNKTAAMGRAASIALLTIGANRSTTRGSVRVGEDDEDEDDSDL